MIQRVILCSMGIEQPKWKNQTPCKKEEVAVAIFENFHSLKQYPD